MQGKKVAINRNTIAIMAGVIAAAGLLLAARYFDARSVLLGALAWIAGLGAAGPLIFVVLYVAACVLLLPGSILTLGGGAVFGVLKGGLAVYSGALLGATCAFLAGRYLARNWVARRLERHPKFKSLDQAVAKEGWKIVLLTRLSPAFPFNLLNYAYGLTQVGLRSYFWASAAGMIPGTLMYVYIGSLAGDLAAVGAAGRARTTGEWVLFAVGLGATVGVTVLLTRLAKKALSARIQT